MSHLVIADLSWWRCSHCTGQRRSERRMLEVLPVTPGEHLHARTHALTHTRTFSIPLIRPVFIKGTLYVQCRESTLDSCPYNIPACKWAHSQLMEVHWKHISIMPHRSCRYLAQARLESPASACVPAHAGSFIHRHIHFQGSWRLTANCISFQSFHSGLIREGEGRPGW